MQHYGTLINSIQLEIANTIRNDTKRNFLIEDYPERLSTLCAVMPSSGES